MYTALVIRVDTIGGDSIEGMMGEEGEVSRVLRHGSESCLRWRAGGLEWLLCQGGTWRTAVSWDAETSPRVEAYIVGVGSF